MCDEMGKAAGDNVTVAVAICLRQAVEDICCKAPALALQMEVEHLRVESG